MILRQNVRCPTENMQRIDTQMEASQMRGGNNFISEL